RHRPTGQGGGEERGEESGGRDNTVSRHRSDPVRNELVTLSNTRARPRGPRLPLATRLRPKGPPFPREPTFSTVLQWGRLVVPVSALIGLTASLRSSAERATIVGLERLKGT